MIIFLSKQDDSTLRAAEDILRKWKDEKIQDTDSV